MGIPQLQFHMDQAAVSVKEYKNWNAAASPDATPSYHISLLHGSIIKTHFKKWVIKNALKLKNMFMYLIKCYCNFLQPLLLRSKSLGEKVKHSRQHFILKKKNTSEDSK